MYKSAVFQRVMAILFNSRPKGYPPRGGGSVEHSAMEHNRREGYESVLSILQLLATPSQPNAEIPITWSEEAPEKEGGEE